ncbi:T9SS type A sorting domain-containing protein [Flavobacterium sp. DGU38]|uniref:T9SS type A sorting domain-containing protein n=1 Tax=Flavobacterium calami TaxID=3139144 RepID=A0ABU9IV18_9FLAO
MKQKLLLFMVFCCTMFVQQSTNAQTTLAPGDIAFIGYQTNVGTAPNNQDGFSFITLKDITATTLVYFTEKGWDGDEWVTGAPNETHLLWNVPAFTPAGTIVSIVETGSATDAFTVSGTTTASVTIALGSGFNLSGGDQMLAYQSTTGTEPASPTFITGIHGDYNSTDYDAVTTWNIVWNGTNGANGGNESALPSGLTNGVNCVSLFPAPGPEIANSKYIGTLTGTSAALSAAINNPANWSHHATNDLGITPSSFPTPSVTSLVLATVTTTAAISIGGTSAVLAGIVTNNGGGTVTERGIVWSTTVNPTTGDNKVTNGSGTGVFSGTVGSLPSSTLIHFRAYAINGAGTSYGADLTFTTAAALNTSMTSQTNIACNGGNTGATAVTATGGAGGYTYSWAPSGGTAATATGLVAGSYTVTITDAVGAQITRNFTLTQPTAFTVGTSQMNVSCNGGTNGSATVSVSGGTGPYIYSWSPSGGTAATASGLAAGNYTVTITDANACTITRNFTITQPPVLNATAAAQTNIACNGGATGSATVAVTGGTPGYTYLWAPTGGTAATASGLVAGTYTVTVTDANGCTDTQSFTITQPSALTATSSQTNTSCNGGANGVASVTVSGGQPSYTYSWSPSGGTAATATGLAAGNYTVTITDANACTITRNFTITQPPVLNATAAAQTNIACNGGATGSATVAVTGGTPGYTYLWAPTGGTAATASGLVAGTYTVTVTDANSCTDTQSFTITQPSALTATSSQTNTSCNGGANGVASVTVSGGQPGYTYSWSPSGGTAATATGLAAGNYTVTITDANACTITRNFTITQPPVLNATAAAQTNIACNGGATGSATVAVTGGTPGYTYLWAPTGGTAATASGLVAGTYTVTVTDANACTDTQSFTITQPSALTATSSQTNLSCNGGANGVASVTVSGGQPGYTYSWSPSGGTAAMATGLTAGNYTVTITDANGCTITRNFTITQPAPFTIGTSQTNVSCNGGANGSAGVTVSGATGPYTYSWAPSGGTNATATGLVAGNYTVTITDANACTITRNFTITQPSVLNATASAQTNIGCNGGATGSATVAVTGGTPGYTYSWAPTGGTAATASGLVAGTYTVTITDANGCTDTQSFTITQPAIINTNVLLTGNTLTANQTGASYQWIKCPATILIGENGQSFTPTATGSYAVVVTVGSCSIISQCVLVSSLADPDIEEKSKFVIYPNPNKGIVNIESDHDADLNITNQLGQTIKTTKVTSDIVNTINLESYSDGVYFITEKKGSKLITHKVILKK